MLIKNAAVERVVFHNQENRYTVLRMSAPDIRFFNAVGHIENPQAGDLLNIEGDWTEHPKYGSQFQFRRADRQQQSSDALHNALIDFLASSAVPGVGPAAALAIVQHFGDDALQVLSAQPERLTEVSGIGDATAQKIGDAWSENEGWIDAALLLNAARFSQAQAAAVHKAYGDGAEEEIRNNPYHLMRLPQIPFQKADALAQLLKFDAECVERHAAALETAVSETARNGHAFADEDQLQTELRKLLGKPIRDLEKPLETLIQERRAVREEGRVYLKFIHDAETRTAFKIRALLSARPAAGGAKHAAPVQATLRKLERELRIRFSDKQREAAHAAASHPIMILTGGPGTGKTTVLKAVLELYKRLKIDALLCAPTGRAAKRMTELTGAEAKTIHRTLRYSPADGDFYHNQHNPLKCGALIVDEISMLDILLMKDLLNAVPRDAKIVFVGDSDQLPSIGPGNVLKDLIRSKTIPVVQLDEIFRQAQDSRIITYANQIKLGETPRFDSKAEPNEKLDCFFIPVDNLDDGEDLIAELCKNRLPAEYQLNPMEDIQVLAPMKQVKLGVENLNRKLQHALNPSEETAAANAPRGAAPPPLRFQPNDKVMQIQNNYDKDIFNGDIGFVKMYNPRARTLSVQFADKIVQYDPAELRELIHAYAVTVHKSQGCQFPAVVLALHNIHKPLLQRNLLYTAVTRAEKLLVIVGSKQAAREAVQNADVEKRNTYLCERLTDSSASPPKDGETTLKKADAPPDFSQNNPVFNIES